MQGSDLWFGRPAYYRNVWSRQLRHTVFTHAFTTIPCAHQMLVGLHNDCTYQADHMLPIYIRFHMRVIIQSLGFWWPNTGKQNKLKTKLDTYQVHAIYSSSNKKWHAHTLLAQTITLRIIPWYKHNLTSLSELQVTPNTLYGPMLETDRKEADWWRVCRFEHAQRGNSTVLHMVPARDI